MAVVIRLQGLPVVAGSVDIRHFFTGLQIPDGGVHIIGGNLGEAFIIFTTDEDARRAMSRTGGVIKNSHIQLYLSSKTEMQNTLEMSRKTNKVPKHPAVPPSGDKSRLAMVKKAGNQNKSEKKNYDSGLNNSGQKHSDTYGQKYDTNEGSGNPNDDLYLFLFGLPYGSTEGDVERFFKGLNVADIIFLYRPNGLKNGNCFVKFASTKDAEAAMAFNNEYMGHRFISISKTTEEKWVKAGGAVGDAYSKQGRKRTRSRSPLNQQFYLHLKNLSFSVEKEDIRRFFLEPDITDTQIKFLLDKNNQKTREGFVMLKSEKLFEKCLDLHNGNLKGRPVHIYPIARKAMLDLIESYETQTPPKQEGGYDYPKRESVKRCIYVRNFPFDVTKVEVLNFFSGFRLREDDVFLLFDNKGVGLGEALVRFPTEDQALQAEGLNRQHFLGTEVLLRRISDEQMKECGASSDAAVDTHMARSPVYRDDYLKPSLPGAHERSYVVSEYDHREFRGSPERPHGSSYSMEFAGRDESFGRYDMENSQPDYNQSFSPHHNYDNGSAGALVRMINLPYSITPAEIKDFFYGYNIIRESIDIKFNRQGMATGHASACFHNYDEALAAVDELNERPIGTRKIILSLSRI